MEVLYLIAGIVISTLFAKLVINFCYNSQKKIKNYRGQHLAVALGMLILLSMLVGELIEVALFASNGLDLLFVYTAVFLFGYIDDISNDKTNKGFKGHTKAFLKGNLTSGFLKACGIPLILLIYITRFSLLAIIEVIFLSMLVNLFNFLDLRPGRCQKVFIFSFLPLTLLTSNPQDYFILGVIMVTLYLDLTELSVLGDGGSNLLGALVALKVLNLPIGIKLFIYFIVLVMTIIGEKYSYNRLISKSKLLSFIDQIGRKS
ncbi:hypothetical protein PRVXH_001703 [Proteinivorax hydrogeniformans]|uniref:UDP-N-acetylmuramyl pentapeptide phosphotransferase/UDP-N-acetylglucosamine-1-phosphate transferase n=1 Tax=Proteinivorax hydrogeniformans TaxID=1826727 RepID=A0AAU8HQQ6_9FIRM